MPLTDPPSPNFLPDTFDTSFLSVLRLGVIICVAAVTVVLRTRILLLLLVASIGHPTIGEASLSKGEVTGFYTLGRPYRMHFKQYLFTSNLGKFKLDILFTVLPKTTGNTNHHYFP